MLWREGRKLWIFSLGNDTKESWLSLRYPSAGQLIDLDNGVVENQAQVGSSTYLVSQPWVNQKIFDMVVNGDLIMIAPFKKSQNYECNK